MCEFCHQHGEGEKWYLQAKNYSDDLLHDLKRRRFGFVNKVVRLACACRNVRFGSDKERYCYGVSLSPQGGIYQKRIEKIDPDYLDGPDTPNIEVLTKEQALDYFRQYEKEGICHTVWTFITPFIG